ncbi:MAG: serine/threonine protein kinase, partial [Planctomycetaceae bacterium]|nr:serine/threonine protein kinase [Planctomycetaceae bacterium]
MADYIELREQGKAPSPEAYLNAFPQHSAELRTFFRNHHWLDESAPPPVTSLAGMTIGPYEIEAEIARGG